MANSCHEEISASSDGMATTHQGVSVASVAAFVEKRISRKASPSTVGSEEAEPRRILQRFDSMKVPQISLLDYMKRLKNLGHCDTSLLIGLIYIDRILAADTNFAVTEKNVHRLVLTCTIVAERYLNDDSYVNWYYASVGGICPRELHRLQAILLNVLMWRLEVSPEQYEKKKEDVRHSFAHSLPAAGTKRAGSWKEWIVLKEAVCETQREGEFVKPSSMSESSSSMQATAVSSSTVSGSAVSGDETESASDASEMLAVSDAGEM
jgi:hypothetical protein